jgi:hypothetical protein
MGYTAGPLLELPKESEKSERAKKKEDTDRWGLDH